MTRKMYDLNLKWYNLLEYKVIKLGKYYNYSSNHTCAGDPNRLS